MSFEFTLERQDEGDCATIYSFRKEGSDRTEIEKFWAKTEVQEAPDRDALRLRLYDELLNTEWWSHPNLRSGKFSWFRDESEPTNTSFPYAEALWAPIPSEDKKDLPEPPPSLRLYFFHVMWPEREWRGSQPEDTQIFVFGNGGVKDIDRVGDVGRRDEEEKELERALRDVRYVMERVHHRIEWEKTLEITESGYLLEGNRHFKKTD